MIPRAEYPRPQFVRDKWVNLNGMWTCELNDGQPDVHSRGFSREIVVPFCPESSLSGIGHTDFIETMSYHRTIEIPRDWNERVLLHFGGVDYECAVFIDGALAGRHAGGQCAFCFDISNLVRPGGSHSLVVGIRDNLQTGLQPSGKQSPWPESRGCHYTRVTGIWQTVWMEPVPKCGLRDVRIVPDLDNHRFILTPAFWATETGKSIRVTLFADGEPVRTRAAGQKDGEPVLLDVPACRTWSPESPFLYDLVLEVLDGSDRVVDRVESYAGMRKIHIEDGRIFLNGEPLYQRLVLDQGYYPDGIWTAPSDEALRRDIELSMAAGFNGARLHQKVFEPRFHYWADKMGYLTWGEASSWGCNAANPEARANFLREWEEIVLRDRNHPSIVTWTPWNECWDVDKQGEVARTLISTYELTGMLDATRPVNTASGGAHCRTDIWSVHSYCQDGPALTAVLAGKQDDHLGKIQGMLADMRPYEGQPVMLDEFGGIRWQDKTTAVRKNDWGYGDTPASKNSLYARLAELVDAVVGAPDVAGFCYTQLTDVEQEVNGVYTYERRAKFDMERIRSIFGKPRPC